jgi:hypothetical protein
MKLIYFEGFRDARDAWAREKDLKQYSGSYRALMRRIINSVGIPAEGRAG